MPGQQSEPGRLPAHRGNVIVGDPQAVGTWSSLLPRAARVGKNKKEKEKRKKIALPPFSLRDRKLDLN